MPKTGLLLLTVMFAACGTDPGGSNPIAPLALALDESAAPTAEACLVDVSSCPPQDWIDSPAELALAFPQKNSDCDFVMFPDRAVPQWDFLPTAACQQRQWGESGIYRMQARDIFVPNLPARCGGPGRINYIRICALAWKSMPTPLGQAGAAGCVLAKIEVTCGV
jgi:hypothetical protein